LEVLSITPGENDLLAGQSLDATIRSSRPLLKIERNVIIKGGRSANALLAELEVADASLVDTVKSLDIYNLGPFRLSYFSFR
jgi:hypothetical protein